MSNASYASNLIIAAQIYSSYSTYITFGLGFIGNILNILVFTKLKIFRHNRCAFYLVADSFVDMGQLTQNFVNEIWKANINRVEPASVSIIWCKLRTIFPQWLRLLLSAIVCFAAIDQFLSTNPAPHLRRLSSLKMARYQICLATCLCLLHTIPSALYQQSNPSVGCIISNSGWINYLSYFYYPIFNGLFPIFVSSLFSVLAYRNVRRIVRRQVPLDRRRLDQQLTAMIFVRVIFYVWLQLPFTIYRIYSLNVVTVSGSTIAYATDRWIQGISNTLVNFTYVVNFYIFMGTSSRYRRQVKCFLMKRCWQSLKYWCHGRQNTIHRVDRESLECGTELE